MLATTSDLGLRRPFRGDQSPNYKATAVGAVSYDSHGQEVHILSRPIGPAGQGVRIGLGTVCFAGKF